MRVSTPTNVAGVLGQSRRCGRAADIGSAGVLLLAAVVTGEPEPPVLVTSLDVPGSGSRTRSRLRGHQQTRAAETRVAVAQSVEHRAVIVLCEGACDRGSGSADRNARRMLCGDAEEVSGDTGEMWAEYRHVNAGVNPNYLQPDVW